MPTHDLLVIGAGPGGYTAALRAAQLGLDTACIEKDPTLGGTCLNVGCIPSKALLESSELFEEAAKGGLEAHGFEVQNVKLDLGKMLARKDKVVKALTTGIAGLFKKGKITRYEGQGRLAGEGKVVVKGAEGEQTIHATHILIATGSSVATIPGVEIDHDRVGSSTDAIAYPEVPNRLVVIGAGYIGLELGSVWRRLGSEVIVLEYLDRILPGMDLELAKAAQKIFEKQGLKFHLGAKVTGVKPLKTKAKVEIEGQDTIDCDRVLVAVGRKPNTEGLGLEAVGIQTDKRGCIPVNDHFETSVPGLYAIGDVIRGPMLAHKAEEEGVACVERIATGYGHVNYDAIPGVCYTHPEIASVGKTEEQLQADGTPYRKGKFPFMANGRAKALNQVDGFVKILAHKETDRILGVHIIGPRAGDLIAEAVAAIEFGATSEDLARTSHAHPTLAEVVKEAALGVDGRSLNI
ncbi:MAG: dihydrolipoyl dehydrogenase [Bryobacterales bacterium]|nr:dihydrolipoyl dehydrogenase [Bryobacterales bacterium]